MVIFGWVLQGSAIFYPHTNLYGKPMYLHISQLLNMTLLIYRLLIIRLEAWDSLSLTSKGVLGLYMLSRTFHRLADHASDSIFFFL